MQVIQLTHKPEVLSGAVELPLSKSINNRLQVLHYLARTRKEHLRISDAHDSQILARLLLDFPHRSEIDVEDAGPPVCPLSLGDGVLEDTEARHSLGCVRTSTDASEPRSSEVGSASVPRQTAATEE